MQRFDTVGQFVLEWGSEGSDQEQFLSPGGIAVDASASRVYVVDTGNHRVQQFDPVGQFLAEWGDGGG